MTYFHHHHRHRHRRRRLFDGGRPSRYAQLMMALGVIALMAVMLLGVKMIGGLMETEVVETRGDLEGRFEPTLTLRHNYKTYSHQELDYTTILFIGVDKPTLNSAMLREGGQADFLLLMTIDREGRQIDLLHIDRDTMADVQVYGVFGNPAGTREMQIALSYAFGADPQLGCENVVQAVETMLGGIPVDHYVALDMGGMAILNDVLGGVTVTLEEDFSDLDATMTAGRTIKLQGRQAEHFLRSRQGIGDQTNKSRMNRQNAFMAEAMEMLSDRLEEDAGFMDTLLKALENHTVLSCSNGWLVNQAYAARKYTRTGIIRLEGEHTIGSDGFVEFHPDDTTLMEYIIDTFCEKS